MIISFPTLSEIAYNHLLSHLDGYKVKAEILRYQL